MRIIRTFALILCLALLASLAFAQGYDNGAGYVRSIGGYGSLTTPTPTPSPTPTP